VKVALAATWPPRGELPRLLRLWDSLTNFYETAVIVVPPDVSNEVIQTVGSLPGVDLHVTADWRSGKHQSLRLALKADVEWVQYCDFDRLLHWLECYPEELAETLRATSADCLIVGRTERAWATHPRCMIETEALFSVPFSHLLHCPMDLGAGSRVFSRKAAEIIVEQCPAEWGWAVDVAWPLALQAAGCSIAYREVDGLAWETPDQHREHAADEDTRQQMVQTYDSDPVRWHERVAVADEIIRMGVRALEKLAEEETRDE
jgi:hypothetical protein